MDDYELQALTRLREEVPLGPVSSRAERLFHYGLDGHNAGQSARPRTWRRAAPRRVTRPAWWSAVAVGLTGALAAGAAGAVVLSSRSAVPATSSISVAELAFRTSAAAARQPFVGPRQWVYRELVQYGALPFPRGANASQLAWTYRQLAGHAPLPPVGPAATGPVRVQARWATADDRTNAFFYDGKLVVGPWAGFVVFNGRVVRLGIPSPVVSYVSLGSLPTDPRALVTRLGGGYASGTAAQRDWHAFMVIGTLLSSYVMTPRLTAELYRALGDIPGVAVDDHAVDLAGQPGIGFLVHLPGAAGSAARIRLEIVVNPRTYQFMGFQRAGGQTGQPSGVAVVRQALVSGPGVRP